MSDKLGHIQQSCLSTLNRKGAFHIISFRNGWYWSSHRKTVRVFDSLVKRGMVYFDGTQYSITQAGKDHPVTTLLRKKPATSL